MRILLVDFGSFILKDLAECLQERIGREALDTFFHPFRKGDDRSFDPELERSLAEKLSKSAYDCVISTNFSPVVAEVCRAADIPYIAWSYDTPMNVLPCEQMGYSNVYIFLFDKLETQKYKDLGFEHFYHLPLAVNTKRLNGSSASGKYRCDISMVGKLYRSMIFSIIDPLSDDLKQFFETLIQTQTRIPDRYIADEMITPAIVGEINRQYRLQGIDIEVVAEALSYSVAEHVTYLDRITLLELLGKRHDVHLYTYEVSEEEKRLMSDVRIHGSIDYYDEMPILFKSSRINLNISLRSARSAIPLRAIDVIGCGGFLLSNAQPELAESFEDKKELALYSGIEEAMEIADYYLSHETEREKVALAGYERVCRDFQYADRIDKMFKTAGLLQ